MKTDADLQQDVNDDLNWDAAIDASHLSVSVHAGIATISGHIKYYVEKLEAERVAESVAGVKAAIVHIEVKPPVTPHDADIAAAAAGALAAMARVLVDSIDIDVKSGWITLAGSVLWDYQRQQAEDAMRSLPGLRGLTNDIRIVPAALPASTIKASIETALKRHFDSERQAITVRVTDAVVTLSGTVTSWYERHLARKSAWNAPGVHRVEDDLVVGP